MFQVPQKPYRDIIDPVIDRNTIFSDDKNTLLATFGNDVNCFPSTYKRTWSQKDNCNFETSDYIDLTNWNDRKLTEPLAFLDLPDKNGKTIVLTGDNLIFQISLSYSNSGRCVKIAQKSRQSCLDLNLKEILCCES